MVFLSYSPDSLGFGAVGPIFSGLFFVISRAHWAAALVFGFLLFSLLYGLGLAGLGRFWSPVFFSLQSFSFGSIVYIGFSSFNLSHSIV